MAIATSIVSHGLAPYLSPDERSDARTTLQRRVLDLVHSPTKRRASNCEAQIKKSNEVLKLLKEATHLLDRQNLEIDPQTYAVLLKSCIHANSLPAGQFLHLHILTNGYEKESYLCNFLIEMYGKCGGIEEARYIFDCLDQRNVYSWTIIIAAYIHHGKHKEARRLFQQMQLHGEKPNKFTFTTVLGTCLTPADAKEGEIIHVSAILNGFDTDAAVGTALINMYGKCKAKEDAQLVFEKIEERDIVAWNAIIAVNAQHRDDQKTLELFRKMKEGGIKPNAITFSSVLGACNTPEDLLQGEIIHAEIVGSGYLFDIVIQNALIDMYGKCGDIASAQAVFDKIYHPNVVSWTSIITVHSQHPRQALQLFWEMLASQLQPNEFTFVAVLAACGNLKAVVEGQLIHQLIIEVGLLSNIKIATALTSMYGRCTTVEDARWVFSHVHARDLVLWNAMIAVYAKHGIGKDALDAFHLMEEEGQKPDEITFTSIFHACSLSGLLEEACQIYRSMMPDYNILPSIQHYGCMVDLLGRSSLMEEAEDFIDTMPIIPNVVIWETFVNACRVDCDKKQMGLASVK